MGKTTIILVISLYLFCLLGLGLSVAQEPASEDPEAKKLIPIGNITVMGSYSKVMGGSDLSGLYALANFAPAIKLDANDYLIPLYSGLYTKQRQIINEEEGGQLYSTMMSHNFSLMHKHGYSETLIQRIIGFASLNYNKETSDESFGDGLYDYRDYGASVDYQYILSQTEAESGVLLLGGKYYFRQYPNFQSLIALASVTAPEKDEKDQNVWGLNLRYTRNFINKLTWQLSYDFLSKYFTDKHTIDESGVLEDGKRKDRVHFFKMQGNYKMGERLLLGLDAEIELNNSNQDYYDSMNTALNLGDDVFVPHYFNYNKYEVRPSLTYLFPLDEKKNIALKLSYAYALRDYPNRNIKDTQGVYKSELQEDNIHAGFLSFSYPITEKFSFLLNADYIHTISNMEYEQFYHYDYDIFHILAGLSYKF